MKKLFTQPDFIEFQKKTSGLTFEYPLSTLSTFGIGGCAAVLFEPENEEILIEFLNLLNENNQEYFVVGGGSNILFADSGFNGAIIRLHNKYFQEIVLDNNFLKVGAGAISAKVMNYSITNNFAGLECLAGIPGTIGGAVFMNAGAGGKDLQNAIYSIDFIDRQGNKKTLQHDKLCFSYRRLEGLPKDSIITSICFNLANGDVKLIKDELIKKRSKSQPYGTKSAGCVFKNPKEYAAGYLIESCGLKGYKIGGAEISKVHANFIINTGNAKAEDVNKLIEIVKSKVWDEYNIELETEIKRL